MKINGVKIEESKMNDSVPRFYTPYGDQLVSRKNVARYIAQFGKTLRQLILDVNNLKEEDLPLCSICKTNRVRITGHNYHNLTRIDIFNPRLDEVCEDNKCIYSISAVKRNHTALKNGNHPTQTKKIRSNYTYRGENYDSETEVFIAKRYYNFLHKYYNSLHLRTAYYHIGGKTKLYIADYEIKPEFKGTKNLPDVIEVKSGTIWDTWYNGYSEAKINYAKFKAVIDSGRSILILDVDYFSQVITKYYLRSLNDLEDLFSKSNKE